MVLISANTVQLTAQAVLPSLSQTLHVSQKIKEAETMHYPKIIESYTVTHALTCYDTTQDMQLTNLMYRGLQLEAYLLAGILDPPHHTLSMREGEDTSSYIPLYSARELAIHFQAAMSHNYVRMLKGKDELGNAHRLYMQSNCSKCPR